MIHTGKAAAIQMIQTAASMLSFTADKEKYNVGDEVTLTIPSSKGGRGLVSIENGSKVLRNILAGNKTGPNISLKRRKVCHPIYMQL